MEFNQLITLIVTNGTGAICSAFVVWLCWYRETKTTPQMIEAFTLSITASREHYQKWHEENRDRLETIQGELREIKTAIGDKKGAK